LVIADLSDYSFKQLQGVSIHQKHFEIVVGQMCRKVRITQPGGTRFLLGEVVDKSDVLKENALAEGKGEPPAQMESVLLGIKPAAARTNGFLGAASFESTSRILTNAAVLSKRDDLLGLKENVVTGGLIPVGTGFKLPETIAGQSHQAG
jgi:DNA-directed RNA polymerase subunit beta'